MVPVGGCFHKKAKMQNYADGVEGGEGVGVGVDATSTILPLTHTYC